MGAHRPRPNAMQGGNLWRNGRGDTGFALGEVDVIDIGLTTQNPGHMFEVVYYAPQEADVVIAASGIDEFVAMSSIDDSVLWSKTVTETEGDHFSVYDNELYYIEGNMLYTLHPWYGNVTKTWDLSAALVSDALQVLEVVGDYAFITDFTQGLTVVQLSTETVSYHFNQTNTPRKISHSPIDTDNEITYFFVQLTDYFIYGINYVTGEELWTTSIPSADGLNSPKCENTLSLSTDNTLILICQGLTLSTSEKYATVYIVDAITGNITQTTPFEVRDGDILGQAAVELSQGVYAFGANPDALVVFDSRNETALVTTAVTSSFRMPVLFNNLNGDFAMFPLFGTSFFAGNFVTQITQAIPYNNSLSSLDTHAVIGTDGTVYVPSISTATMIRIRCPTATPYFHNGICNVDCPTDHIFPAGLKTCFECADIEIVNGDRSECVPCVGGFPNGAKTVCDDCTTNTFANVTAFTCQACPTGSVPNVDHTACDVCPSGNTDVSGENCVEINDTTEIITSGDIDTGADSESENIEESTVGTTGTPSPVDTTAEEVDDTTISSSVPLYVSCVFALAVLF